MTIGTRIKTIIKFKGIEQKDLAKNVGMTQTKISRIVNNKCKPNINDVEKIANFFQCTIVELMGHSPLFEAMLTEVEGRLV